MYPNLIAAMSQKGITIEALAKLLGVHRNTVANKMSGESDFTFEQAMRISEVIFPEYKPSYIFQKMEKTA